MQVRGIDHVGPSEFADVPHDEAFPFVSELMGKVQSLWSQSRVSNMEQAVELARGILEGFNQSQHKYVVSFLGVQNEERHETGTRGQFGLSFKYRVLN